MIVVDHFALMNNNHVNSEFHKGAIEKRRDYVTVYGYWKLFSFVLYVVVFIYWLSTKGPESTSGNRYPGGDLTNCEAAFYVTGFLYLLFGAYSVR